MNKSWILLLGIFASRPAHAAEIRVERDGTGNFTTIQAAADAAATGDTILIGPGRFDERALVTTPGWSVPVYVLVQSENLTFIGAGGGRTIIGQAGAWDVSQPWTRGIEAGVDWGSTRLRVEGIRFENITFAISGHPGPNIDVVNCQFSGDHYGVFMTGPVRVNVQDCELSGLPHQGRLLYSSGNDELIVRNCLFQLDPAAAMTQTAVQAQGTASVLIEASRFVTSDHGLNIVGGGPTVIRGCTFEAHRYESVLCRACSSMEVVGCGFSGSGYAIAINQGQSSIITVSDSIIENAVDGSIALSSANVLNVRNCVLDRGRRYVVDQYSFCDKRFGDLVHLDMRNNDWGTTVADSIEAWIHICDYVVDYIPFVGQPTATETTSWGKLKASFR